MYRRPFIVRAAWLALASGTSLGCSAGDKGSTFKPPTGTGETTVATGGGAAGAGIGSGGGSSTTGSIVVNDASVGVGGAGGSGIVEPDAACAVGSAAANLAPVNMFMTFDRSGSMAMNNKWQDATTALTAFMKDPGTAGLRVALRFFPDNMPAAGCDDLGCSVAACSQPLVPLAPLLADPAPIDTQEDALVQSLATTMPSRGNGGGGGTPLFAALGGAEQWAIAYATAHPDEKTVVILVTDGEPNGCDENITDIAGLAAAALQSNMVLTYAIGLQGSAQAQMDQIAVAGGTMNGIFILAGAMSQMQLLAALTAIRGRSLSCDFPVPTPMPGETLDPTRVNVVYTPGNPNGGPPRVTFGQVPDAAGCAGSNGGWYYDNVASPTRIFLCPSVCDSIRMDSTAKLEILLDYKTIIKPDRKSVV